MGTYFAVVRRHLPGQFRKIRGKWVPTKADRLARRKLLLTESGYIPITVIGSRKAGELTRWGDLEYVLLANGQKTRLSSAEMDDEGEESFVIDDAPHKLREVAKRYSESVEHKSLAPDGSRCTGKTKGLLRRRPIRASGVFQLIGKEVDRGTSTDPEYFSGEDNKLMRYGVAKRVFPEALRGLSVRELMKRTGLSNDTIQRAKNGERIHPKTARKLSWCARLIKKT